MKLTRWFVYSAAVTIAFVSGAASAAITYLDAEIDPAAGAVNTTLTNGANVPFTLDGGSGGTGSDGLWRKRTFASNGPSVYESNGDFNGGANSEDNPRLRTRITGLASGSYNIYAYFVGNHPDMRMAASLTDDAGHLPVYTVGNGGFPGDGLGDQVTDAELANFTNVVINDTAFGNDTLYEVFLGTASSIGGMIDVFIDDDTTAEVLLGRAPVAQGGGGDGGSLRTVYEGVGYEAVVPEPAAAGLAIVAALGLFVRRRG